MFSAIRIAIATRVIGILDILDIGLPWIALPWIADLDAHLGHLDKTILCYFVDVSFNESGRITEIEKNEDNPTQLHLL